MRFTNKDLSRLIVPLMIEQLLAVAVGFVDSFMVSSAGEAAISAVSLVDTVMILMINIFTALATGGAVVAGQYIGQGRTKDACKATEQLILFIAVFSLGVTVLIYAAHYWILHGVFGQIDHDVMESAKIYLLITAGSIPFLALYNGGAAIFRAMGNSRISMYTSLSMNILNIIGNFILIYGLKMGVAGAAIPTLVSRIFAAVMILVLLRSSRYPVHLERKLSFHFDKGIIKKILHIGIPNSLENSMFQMGKILVLSLVSTFGLVSIAANAVTNTVAMFQMLPGMAMCLALLTVVSQCVGAGEYDQAKYYTKKLMIIAYGLLIVINIGILFLLPTIVRVYHLTEETGMLAEKILTYHGICGILIWPLSFILPNTLRAANDVKFTMVVAIVSMWIFRIGFSYVLGKYLGWGVFGVWVAMTIDWMFRLICFVIRYVRGKWQQHQI